MKTLKKTAKAKEESVCSNCSDASYQKSQEWCELGLRSSLTFLERRAFDVLGCFGHFYFIELSPALTQHFNTEFR